MAVAALVLGIVAVVLSFIPCASIIGLPCAILGIIFGALGINQANKTGEGKGMAIAGLVCSIVSILIWVLAYFWIMTLFRTGVDAIEALEGFQ